MTKEKLKKFILPAIIVFAIAVAAIVVAVVVGANKDAYRLIKVKNFEGAVTIQRDEKIDAFKGLQLVSKDKVEVGKSSMLELLADKDKHIVAEENTAFQICSSGNEKNGNITIELMYGEALFTIDKKLSENSSFEVNTPNATLSVRGTEFQVIYNAETETTFVKVLDGVVAVITEEENEKLREDESAVITSEGITIKDKVKKDDDNDNGFDNDNFDDEKGQEHTIKAEHYDGNGNCFSYTIYEYNPNDNTIKGSKCKDDGTIITSDIVAEYDSVGNTLKKVMLNGLYYIYEYDSDGNVIKRSEYDSKGEFRCYEIYEYDSVGNKIKTDIFRTDDTLASYYIHEYDSNGNLIKESLYNEDKELEIYDTYEYDSNGNKTKYSNFNKNGAIQNYYTYEYNSDGNMVKYSRYNSDGTYIDFEIYEYDSDSNNIRTDNYNPDGTLRSYHIYEYDSDGNMTKDSFYLEDGKLMRYDIYEYNSPGDMINARLYFGNGVNIGFYYE